MFNAQQAKAAVKEYDEQCQKATQKWLDTEVSNRIEGKAKEGKTTIMVKIPEDEMIHQNTVVAMLQHAGYDVRFNTLGNRIYINW